MQRTIKLPDGIEYLGPLPEKKDNFINKHYLKIKRFNDFVLSLIFIGMVWPLLLLITIFIKLDSKGPVFYTQERISKNGKPFKMFKLRTMVQDADKIDIVTHQNDSRITKVGNIIRYTSLDEIPQIINILMGDMSFVGPRAQPTKFKEQWEKEGILEAQPGILSWAVLHGREQLPYEDRFVLEREYIEKLSWQTDSFIVFTTLAKYKKIFHWVLIPLVTIIILAIILAYFLLKYIH